ncbi:MAG: FeoA family protein [Eubacteriales bacterium]|nr:FeoA family protein [Eubacteriales bacterium]
MQPLSKAEQGNIYTIKWMFGLPEALEKMRAFQIHEGSVIQVLQKYKSCLIIRFEDRRIVLGNEVADRIQV